MVSDLHRRYLIDQATLWRRSDDFDSAGDPTFELPVYIEVRWEDQLTSFIGADGEQVNASGFIMHNTDIEIGDFVYLGETYETDPRNVAESRRVLGTSVKKTPSGRFRSKVAYLSFRRRV